MQILRETEYQKTSISHIYNSWWSYFSALVIRWGNEIWARKLQAGYACGVANLTFWSHENMVLTEDYIEIHVKGTFVSWVSFSLPNDMAPYGCRVINQIIENHDHCLIFMSPRPLILTFPSLTTTKCTAWIASHAILGYEYSFMQ